MNTEEPKVHRHRPVVIYMSILLAAVVLLLVMSYVTQQRSTDRIASLTETVAGLQSSSSAHLETINKMQATIDTQKGQIDKLTGQLEEAETLQAETEEAMEEMQAQLDDATLATQALMYLYELMEEYDDKDFNQCKEIISTMEEKGMDKVLPEDSPVLGQKDPHYVYMEIAEDVKSASGGTKTDNMGDLP